MCMFVFYRGYGCADPLHPGVYSRVSTAIDWIEENTCSISPQSCVLLTSESTNSSSLSRNSSSAENIANIDGSTSDLIIRSPLAYAQELNQRNPSSIYKILTNDLGKPTVLTATVLGCFLLCCTLALMVVKGARYVRQGSRKDTDAAALKNNIEVAVPSSPNMPTP